MAKWVVRPRPSNIDRMQEFLHEGIIAVGWLSGEDLSNLSEEEIRSKLLGSNRSVGLQTSMIMKFADVMKPGDMVLVPDGEDIHIARVEGSYTYVKEKAAQGYPHQRRVKFLKKVLRGDQPDEVRRALRGLMALYAIKEDVELERPVAQTNQLTEKALQVLFEALNSDDPQVRIQAAEVVIKERL